MAVLPRPHPSSQPLEVRRELSSVLLDRDAVDPHRGVAPQGSIRTFERWLVDEVSQREDALVRMSLRSLRYLHESW